VAEVIESRVVLVGDVRIDHDAHAVEIGGTPVTLGPQMFTILSVLMRHAGKLVTHEVLVRALGGASDAPDRNAVRINVSRLRTVLGTGELRPQIETERYVGYRLVPPVERAV
jgi:two-component system KDP operon response regulator KdpE